MRRISQHSFNHSKDDSRGRTPSHADRHDNSVNPRATRHGEWTWWILSAMHPSNPDGARDRKPVRGLDRIFGFGLGGMESTTLTNSAQESTITFFCSKTLYFQKLGTKLHTVKQPFEQLPKQSLKQFFRQILNESFEQPRKFCFQTFLRRWFFTFLFSLNSKSHS